MSDPSQKLNYLLPEKVRDVRHRGTRYDGNKFYNFRCRILLILMKNVVNISHSGKKLGFLSTLIQYSYALCRNPREPP